MMILLFPRNPSHLPGIDDLLHCFLYMRCMKRKQSANILLFDYLQIQFASSFFFFHPTHHCDRYQGNDGQVEIGHPRGQARQCASYHFCFYFWADTAAAAAAEWR